MNFTAEPMTNVAAAEILNWRYPYPYDFYNNEMTEESLIEFLDGTYRAVRDENRNLFGFYCTGKSAQVPAGRKVGAYPEGFIDFGLGMEPKETGRGKGNAFFDFIRLEIHELQPEKPLRLTVAAFNERAIHLYENFSFVKDKEFKTDFAKFQTMVADRNRTEPEKTPRLLTITHLEEMK
ncbi:N-acetyltransferase [Metaplanococcus flavidus]|uniref:GNAT family N-acetyltransferase n=1 Tax=Metaplanococcus flavidus TaxID=569883 RepID=A0ABW3LCK4_9BACL